MIEDDFSRVENALRRLIEDVLRGKHGGDWENHLGATAERRTKWEERREEQRKKSRTGVVDERILYYTDFTDLWDIIRRDSNWPLFVGCFANKKHLEVYLGRLGDLRNPRAHSRALLPFEQALVAGMSEEIRQAIVAFRNAGGGAPEPEHFARIEEISESHGFIVFGKASGDEIRDTRDQLTLRPGDTVKFSAAATDPQGRPLRWRVSTLSQNGGWTVIADIDEPTFENALWSVTVEDVHDHQEIVFELSSVVGPHRFGDHDDTARFVYRVLPQVS